MAVANSEQLIIRILSLLIICSINVATYAQVATEIYLFDIKFSKNEMILSNPVNITKRIGYDNQPFFHPDLPVLFYVSSDEKGNTDIMEFNYELNGTRKFKETPEREYSPQVTPDKKFISCIIQRENGEQNLGKYPITGGDAVILINNLTVGYHAWIDENTVAVFTLPQPFALHVIKLSTGADSIISTNIGRSLHRNSGEASFTFVQKTEKDEWIIKKFNAVNQTASAIVNSIQSKERDMALTSEEKIIMSDEKNIFFFDPSKTTDWKKAKLPNGFSPNTITRLAVNPGGNKLAIVVNE